ncbi:tetratricopeptide repeat protein [Caproiciproducens sp. CPB-2]|uniref:tetratricopeptide repeat protein n=1 Tax=Caproiciproducens sp. CPB-2 TaxID=3030017 RepID=UPI0023DB8DC7|nr:tetratricopeptide repeat protein [Caproiciproducens sp. CPB-2]MDF1495810.1 tetratricopeptide repeat protein [Caproiciproducens sp. CPB-2]
MKHLFSSNRTLRIAAIVLVTVAGISAVAVGIYGYNYIVVCQKEQAYTEQIGIGNNDISNKKYDTAIAAFSRAIEMKGTDTTPYLGLAEAYIGKQDYDSAVKCLQTGFAKTQNTAFNAKMEEVTALIDNKKKRGMKPPKGLRSGSIQLSWHKAIKA